MYLIYKEFLLFPYIIIFTLAWGNFVKYYYASYKIFDFHNKWCERKLIILRFINWLIKIYITHTRGKYIKQIISRRYYWIFMLAITMSIFYSEPKKSKFKEFITYRTSMYWPCMKLQVFMKYCTVSIKFSHFTHYNNIINSTNIWLTINRI